MNVRGRANYTCRDYEPLHPETRWSCEEGGGERGCQYADTPFCTYRARVKEACWARVVQSNYAYWLHARATNRRALEAEDTEPVGLLVCDEVALAFGALSSFLSTWVSSADLRRFADKAAREALAWSKGAESGRVTEDWRVALQIVWRGAHCRVQELAREYGTEQAALRGSAECRKLDRLCGNLGRLVGHAEAESASEELRKRNAQPNWLWRLTKSGVAFDVIWPGRYAERYLWSGVPRVVGLSASLRPKTLQLLNIRAQDSWFREWPRVFAAELSPVYWVPTGRLGKDAPADEKWKSIARADEVYDVWREYKGIVHTTSYANAEWYQANCKWGRHMILSKPGEQGIAAERYKRASPPCLLVSPSFSTGWDFPEEDCGFQHIPKLPFPDRSDPVMLARIESDEGYYDYATMQTLFQACGRKARRGDQRSVTIITDDAVKNFRRYSAQYAPKYFRVRDSNGIPKPPT